jgi:ribonuclease R
VALEAFCAAAGFHPGFGTNLTPLGLAALSAQLDAAADDTAAAVWDVLLGFLGRASYRAEAGRHFGLASEGYLHFTSPIRRYADLVVHRVVHAFLAGERDLAQYPEGGNPSELCRHLDASARTASMAERQMRKALWLLTLSTQVAADPGTTFPGRVTGIGPKGAFVTLDGSRVSGMVGIRSLSGKGWKESPDGLALVEDGGQRLGYGDAVVVAVTSADVEAGELELKLAGTSGRGSGGSSSPRKRTSGAGRRRPART